MTNRSLLEEYNSLTDKYLSNYFGNDKIKRHLIQRGLIKKYEVIPNDLYRLDVIKDEKWRELQECLASCVVERARDLERQKQAIVTQKIETMQKIQQVESIKQRSIPSPYLLPILPRQYIPPSSFRSSRTATPKMRASSSRLTNSGRLEQLNNIKTSPRSAGSVMESRRLVKPKPLPSICTMTFQFAGPHIRLASRRLNPRYRIVVNQQHCGGNPVKLFQKFVIPGEEFDVVSRRHLGFPFSLTFSVNGLTDLKLSSCCEYKYKPGSRMSGPQGIFILLNVTGSSPCYKCQSKKLKRKGVTIGGQNGVKEKENEDNSSQSRRSSGDTSCDQVVDDETSIPFEADDDVDTSKKNGGDASTNNSFLDSSFVEDENDSDSDNDVVTSSASSSAGTSSLTDEATTSESAATSGSKKKGSRAEVLHPIKKNDVITDWSTLVACRSPFDSSDEESATREKAAATLLVAADVHAKMSETQSLESSRDEAEVRISPKSRISSKIDWKRDVDIENIVFTPDEIEELIDAISRNSECISLSIRACNLTDDLMIRIMEAIRTSRAPIKDIDISSNGLSHKIIDNILKLKECKPSLCSLRLHGNRLEDKGVMNLVKGLRTLAQRTGVQNTRRLDIGDCGFSNESVKELCKYIACSKSLRTLSLTGTSNLHESSWKLIFESLGQNGQLRAVYLDMCSLSDSHLIPLRDALIRTNCLEILDLEGNDLTDRNEDIFEDLLSRCPSLQVLNLASTRVSDGLWERLYAVLSSRLSVERLAEAE